MIFEDTIHIKCDPKKAFDFFADIQKNYLSWHEEHILFQWRKGNTLAEGNVAYFEETIGKQKMAKEVIYNKVIPGKYIEFTMKNWFFRLFLPKMTLIFTPDGEGCRFTAQIFLRVGPVAAYFHKKEFEEVRRHMKEEGENLKNLMERG